MLDLFIIFARGFTILGGMLSAYAFACLGNLIIERIIAGRAARSGQSVACPANPPPCNGPARSEP